MKIGIACDHTGLELKEKIINYLKEQKYSVIDYGPKKLIKTDDYPDYAFKLGEAIRDNLVNYGIAICGTGIGISIACNKVKGVRCAKVSTIKDTKLTRIDNDANIIAISASLNFDKVKRIIETFLTTLCSSQERHRRRIDKITNYER